MCRESREFWQRSELQEGLWTGAMHIKLPCQGWENMGKHKASWGVPETEPKSGEKRGQNWRSTRREQHLLATRTQSRVFSKRSEMLAKNVDSYPLGS